jgi:hypothetical protein
MTIFMHFNQILNSDESPISREKRKKEEEEKKEGLYVALVPLMMSLQFAVQQLRKIMTNLSQYSQSWPKNKLINSSMHSGLFCNSSK